MSEPHIDWTHVVERLAQGDADAYARFGRLVSAHLARCRAYDFGDDWGHLRRAVATGAVAGVRAGRIRDSQALVDYVRVATQNAFADHLQRLLGCDAGRDLPWIDETGRAAATGTPRTRALWEAVSELPPDEQRLLDAVYRQGKTYEEAGVAAGLPAGTAKRRLRTALMALRVRLGAAIGGS